MLRRQLTVRWLALLLLTLVAAAVMVRLGSWQLGRGELRHSVQNYSYAVEWWLFAAFTVFVYVKALYDAGVEREPDEPTPFVPPPPAVAAEEDDELAAYNRYLAELHQKATR